jgi:hypothetical protein
MPPANRITTFPRLEHLGRSLLTEPYDAKVYLEQEDMFLGLVAFRNLVWSGLVWSDDL